MKKRYMLFLSILFLMTQMSYAGAFLPTETIFVSKVEAKQKLLESLTKTFEQLKQEQEDTKSSFGGKLTELKQEIAQTKDALQDDADNEFLSKKLVLLNDHYHALKDYRQARERLTGVVQEHIKLFQEYLEDPDLAKYKAELGLENRIAFSFDDLRQVKEKVEATKGRIQLLFDQEKNTQTEVKSREQAAAALVQRYKTKKEEAEKVKKEEVSETFDLSAQQKRELANLEFALLGTKKEVDETQLEALRAKIKLIGTKIEVEKQQLQILNEAFNRIKQTSIRISEADVAFARDELEKKRQELNAAKIDTYEPKKEQLKNELDQLTEELTAASKQFNVPLGDELDEWMIQPKQTIQGITALLTVAKANEALHVEKWELEELDADVALKDQSLALERIETEIKHSFYKIYTEKFSSEEKVFEEIKQYEVKLSDIRADLSGLESRKATVETRSSLAKKALGNIAQRRQEIIEEKEGAFKKRLSDYTHALDLLNAAEELVKQEVKLLNAIRSTYNDTVLKLLKTEQQIKFTIEELRASSRSIIWDRPEDAISWQGLKNVIPNVDTFVQDLRSYIVHFDLGALIYKIKHLFKEQYSLLYFMLYALLWLLFLGLLRIFLPVVRDKLMVLSKGRWWPRVSLFLGSLLTFVSHYFYVLALWFTLFLLLTYYVIPDPYPYIIFYVLSIPLLLFVAHRAISYFVSVNAQHEYPFVSKEYVRRFVLCLSTFVYATIAIFFF